MILESLEEGTYEEMSYLFHRGLQQYPRSIILWDRYIYYLMDKGLEEEAFYRFDLAVENLQVDSLPLWYKMLLYTQVKGKHKVMSSTSGLSNDSLLVH